MLNERMRLDDEIAQLKQQRDEERAEKKALEARLEALKAILSDPVNQLEQTKGGYYIYRFDLETMHEIADALGIEKAKPEPFMRTYTLDELSGLIRPD